ncbi:MAG: stage II sporulation protein D [Firmicutes bacterium]|nr:stage II sporulation protein D [Bacillota bacterium]
MNRLLVLVVFVLLPVTFVTSKEEVDTVMLGTTLEKIKLDIPVEINDVLDSNYQVLISNNSDKSDPYQIDLEEYIIGVVAGEMPASFNMEALKAQAVAARTFAMYKMKNVDNYVLSTTINDQVYLTKEAMVNKWGNDFEYYYNRVKDAVLSTKGEVITYNDDIIISYYFAISNGYTDDAKTVFNEDRSYLVSVDSTWDKDYSSYSSTRTISIDAFCTNLNIVCDGINIENVIRGENNYVREITINGTPFTGREVFNKLSLKSTDFNIKVNGNDIIIETYGFGHGVGMSQYGAQSMANNNYSYKDILKHYYKNTEISVI